MVAWAMQARRRAAVSLEDAAGDRARLRALPADDRPGHAGAAAAGCWRSGARGRRPTSTAPAEIRALLDATDTLRPPLRAGTYRALMGLLAVTGMRVGEALALDRTDVDLRQQAADDPRTPRATAAGCRCTRRRCRRSAPTRTPRRSCARRPTQPSFFVSTARHALIYECVFETFTKLRAIAGLDESPAAAAHARPAPQLRCRHAARLAPRRCRRRRRPTAAARRRGWATATRPRPTTTCRPRRSCSRSPRSGCLSSEHGS